MSPSVAVSIMRYAAKNGTSAARDKYGSVMYNNALGQAKSKGPTGDMIRKSLQGLTQKSADAAKNIPKAVRDMMLPKGTTSLPKKPGDDIPKRVKKMMVSSEQDAQNKKDAKLKTTDKRAKVTKGGVDKMIKDATSKADSAAKIASRVGKVAKGMTGVGALLAADEVGAGSDVVPAGRRDEFVKKLDAERKAKEEAKKTEAKPAPKAESKPKPTPKPTPKPENKVADEAKKKAAMEKARATDKAGVEARKETARKENARREALRAHNKRITSMSPEDRKKYRESEAGKAGTLLKNRGGAVSKYSSGGMPQRVNCGASMKPTQKSSKGMK